MSEFEKSYEPQKYEDDIYKRWENSDFFRPDKCKEEGLCTSGENFSISLPPPNVTGTLHMGHAAMLAIQDVMIRYHRMKGDKTLWLPGTDHAAIATQTKVEKLLMEDGIENPREQLGREKFLQKVDEFAQQSHDTIVNQTKKMGSSLDWSREKFTLDDELSFAVRTVFKKMYEDGLIYRGHRIVNWCPRCHSTLADDEVEHKEQTAKLYTFKYSKDFPISIATTRPETKLGDTAVAVNPKDSRYKQYIGQVFTINSFANGPDLKIKIIADEEIDMEFGTGALGVTPAHSFVDYDMAQKNDLEVVKVIDEDGKMTSQASDTYTGMNVLEAREKVVAELRNAELLEKEEEINNNLSICYRCSNTIEPIPSKQWFIGVEKPFVIKESKIEGIESGSEVTLKKLMQHVVREEDIEVVPDRFNKTYFHWIDNLRDWCISRQLWYGHRIPVWYKNKDAENEEIYVGVEAPTEEGWEQDSDTLDTWFSSGLWTFSTLGWPNDTQDMKDFHPTSVMETGYDILFFWVARMILMSTYCLGDIPFKTVYLHGLVRDENGKKMSKSLGNVIDPLDMIEKYGADATRLSLLVGNTPGNDMKLSEEKIAGFRNFANKLWNISRFILLNIDEPKIDIKEPKPQSDEDYYVLQHLNYQIRTVTESVDGFKLSYAGEQLRYFTWNVLADVYLEACKGKEGKKEILNYILNTILRLWHPFMPFVTETIWQKIYGADKMLMIEKWPIKLNEKLLEHVYEYTEFDLVVVQNISMIRCGLNEAGFTGKKVEVVIEVEDEKSRKMLENSKDFIVRQAQLSDLIIKERLESVEGWSPLVLASSHKAYYKGQIDAEKENERLKGEIEKVRPYVESLEKKLSNQEFVNNAPAQVVEAENKKLTEAKDKLEKLNQQLENLK